MRPWMTIVIVVLCQVYFSILNIVFTEGVGGERPSRLRGKHVEKKNPKGPFPPASGCLMFGCGRKARHPVPRRVHTMPGPDVLEHMAVFYHQEKHQSSSESNRDPQASKKMTIFSWSWDQGDGISQTWALISGGCY